MGKRIKPRNYGKKKKPDRPYFLKIIKNSILLPDALSSHVCLIIFLVSVFIVYSYSLIMLQLWNRRKLIIPECLLIGGDLKA